MTDDGAERLTLADGSSALAWGEVEYGVISGHLSDPDVADLGQPPKLFVAAEEEAAGAHAAEHMTDFAAGTWNVMLLMPSDSAASATGQP